MKRTILMASVVLGLVASPVAAADLDPHLSAPKRVAVGLPATFTIAGLPPGEPVTIELTSAVATAGTMCDKGGVFGRTVTDESGTAKVTALWPATQLSRFESRTCIHRPWTTNGAWVSARGQSPYWFVGEKVSVDLRPGGILTAGGVQPNGRPRVTLGTRSVNLFAQWGKPEIDERGVVFPFELVADLRGARVSQFTVSTPRWQTSRGIRVGSSEARLKAVYGAGLHRVRYSAKFPKLRARFHYYIASGPNVIAFVMDRGRVWEIDVRRKSGIRSYLADAVGPI